MTDEERPRLFARARARDWDAIEDVVSGALAPTFDAAWHLFGDVAAARQAAEDALFEMVRAVVSGAITDGDPLIACARVLSRAARAARVAPFHDGLRPEDMATLKRRPDDARRLEIARTAAEDRVIAVLLAALDLSEDEVAVALETSPAAIRAAQARVLGAIPEDDPAAALREILDARAAAVRLPLAIEERVLDRFEAGR